MSGWPVPDVAIGLVFVYLLLSLICTAVNEGLWTQLRSRAKFLDQGLLSLLGSQEAKKTFLDHPLIRSYQNQKGRQCGAQDGTRDRGMIALLSQAPPAREAGAGPLPAGIECAGSNC